MHLDRLAGVHNMPLAGAGTPPVERAGAAEEAAPGDLPQDQVSTTESPATGSEMAELQRKKRFFTDVGMVVAGDIPAMVTIAADFGWIPVPDPVLAPLNAFNALTGALGVASDLSVVRDCVNNPDAALKDKAVDVLHLANDVMNTGASMVPLFVEMGGPMTAAGMIFTGGQVLGALGDVAKLAWDHHRGGEQSASSDVDQPNKLVMDNFERRMGQVPMLLACIGSHSVLAPTAALALPAALATTLVSFGGALGAVYGFTQVRKSAQLLKGLEDLKGQGVESFEMPSYGRRGLEHKSIGIDEAVATVKRRKWAGIAQTAASTVLMAAGCLTLPGLLVSGIAASTVFGLAAAGAEVHAHRHEIGARIKAEVATRGQQVRDLVGKVGRMLTPGVETLTMEDDGKKAGDESPPPPA